MHKSVLVRRELLQETLNLHILKLLQYTNNYHQLRVLQIIYRQL